MESVGCVLHIQPCLENEKKCGDDENDGDEFLCVDPSGGHFLLQSKLSSLEVP